MSEPNDGETATTSLENETAKPLAAEEIRALHDIPLFGINGFSLQGGFLELSGLALPANGNPRSVEFYADPGVEFAVEYPLPHPGAAEYYWYWPGAERSAFRLRVDLAASRSNVDYYKFRLRFAGHGKRPLESVRTTIVVPKNIGLLENYPTQAAMRRVQAFETVNSVATTGLTDALRICELGRAYGWDGSGDVLDWGVGHGRVARHIAKFSDATVWGVDIDPDNIAWATSHLPSLSVSVGPLMPPTQYPDNQFSLVYGISVMTHLERSVQEAWLAEIKRILRPGGIALLTFAGDASVAFSSKWLDRAFLDTYVQTGFGPHLTSHDLVGVIDTPEYYKNVKQTIGRAQEICSPYLEVAGAHECMFGYQDLLVLRKPEAPGGEGSKSLPNARTAKAARGSRSENRSEQKALDAALDARIRETLARDPEIPQHKLRRLLGIDPQTLGRAMKRIRNADSPETSEGTSAEDPTLSDKIRAAFERNPNLSTLELRKEIGFVGPGFAEAIRASGIDLGKRSQKASAEESAAPLSPELESRVRAELAKNPDIDLRALASLLGVNRRELGRSLRKSGLTVKRAGKPTQPPGPSQGEGNADAS